MIKRLFIGFLVTSLFLNMTNCGGGSGDVVSNQPQTLTPRYLYVANEFDNTISIYSIDNITGSLISIDNVQTGNRPRCLMLGTNRRYLYVANAESNAISQYAVDIQTGRLSPIDNATTGMFPIWISVSSSGKYLYAANSQGNSISSFSLDDTNGKLTPLDNTPTGLGLQSVSIDSTGKFLYTANVLSGTVSSFSVNSTTGALTFLANTDVAGFPLATVTSPSENLLFVLTFGGGVSNPDRVMAFAIDNMAGTLTSVDNAYTANDLSLVRLYALAMAPSGNYLYATDLSFNALSSFGVNPTSGKLTLVDNTATGNGPMSGVVDPTGKYLYIANNWSNDISAYQISEATGKPNLLGTYSAGIGPISIVVLAVYE